MATRIKTIEYAFALATADVATGVARDFTSFTMYIPESSPVFKSVILEMTAYDTSVAASVTAVLMGISLGAVARNDLTVTQTITNSGENQAFIFTRDVTNYFSTNWTGTSMTVGSRLTITGVGTRSCTSKLIVTYQYDDTDTTQIKTVRIPMEGNTGNLTAVLTDLGGVANQIPALSTWLPETSKVIRDIFFETYTHTGKDAGTTDRTLNMSFNSGTNTISATYESGLVTDYPIKRIDKLISGTTPLYSTASAWSVEASTSNVDMPFPCLSGIYVVTYEFNASTTTEVMNSLLLPIIDENGFIPSGSVDRQRYVKKVYVEEPDTIALDQSAVLFSCIDAGAVGIDLTIGAQTSRIYAHGAATSRAGAMYMMRRFDAGAAEDSTIILSRGTNLIEVDYFTTSSLAGTQGTNATGLIILNYKSGKSPQGIGAHNKTTTWCIRPYTLSNPIPNQTVFSGSRVPEIPETNYWITCNGLETKLLTTGGTAGTLATSIQAEILPTETLIASYTAEGKGWIDYYSNMYNSDAEIGPSIMWNTCKGSFVQNPDEDYNSLASRGHILYETGNRVYRYDQLTAIGHIQVQKYLTYHSITCSIGGTVTNYDPGAGSPQIFPKIYLGGGYNVASLLDSSTDGSGNYSFIWYCDTDSAQITAIQTIGGINYAAGTLAQVISGSNFNISFITGSGGAVTGPTYYSYG